MQSNHQIRLGVLLSYVSMGLGYVVQILYTPLMIRVIGSSQYGVYNLTNSIVSYLSLFSLGFAPAYVRFYMRHKIKDDQESIIRLNGLFMAIFLVLGLIAVIAGMVMVTHTSSLLGSKFSQRELILAKHLMFLMVINIGLSFPLIPVVSYIQANERFIFQNGLNIVRQLCSPFLSLPLLMMGYGALGMTLATTVITFAISIWQIIYAYTRIGFRVSFVNMDFSELKEISVFSIFILLNAITDQINWNVDKFIIGRYLGAIPVAIYGIAAQLNSYYLGFSTVISNVYVPRINKIVAKKDSNYHSEINQIFMNVGKTQLIIIGLVLANIIVLGKEFIIFWAGSQYATAYPILLVLVIPVTIPLIQNAGISIQQAMNRHVFRSVVYFLIAIINVLVSIFLVSRIGSIGAAIGTAGALIIGNGFLLNWYYWRYIKINIAAFWRSMIRPLSVILASVGIGFTFKYILAMNTIFGFVLCAACMSIFYLALTWVFTFSRQQKKSYVQGLRRRLGFNK